ncbi:MAG: endonuclease/exonuclease/phosphatase family protein, partial [Acidobacteriota bacterium]
MDRRLDADRIARVIGEINADIIGLQELDSQYHRKDGHNQFEYLAEATGLNAIYGPTIRNGDSHYGNGLFTSHKVLDVRRIDLSVRGREPRGAIDVDLDIEGKTVRVIVAHLGLRVSERRQQVKRLREIVCEERNHLEVMLG